MKSNIKSNSEIYFSEAQVPDDSEELSFSRKDFTDFYGLSRGEVIKRLKLLGKQYRGSAITRWSVTFKNLESCLDVVLFRCGFFNSVLEARKHIGYGHVKVNGKSDKHPSYICSPGDIINVKLRCSIESKGVSLVSKFAQYVEAEYYEEVDKVSDVSTDALPKSSGLRGEIIPAHLVKAANLEVCHESGIAIFLYTPWNASYPAIFDADYRKYLMKYAKKLSNRGI